MVMYYFYLALLILFGLIIGSFLNVCIDRLPRGGNITKPPSHCDSCGRRLAVLDLLPVVSFLITGGKCRYCGAVIPRRVFWVELFTGAIFGFLYWQFGLTLELAIIAFYISVFIVIFVIDLEHKLILNVIVYPMIFAALLISTLYPNIIAYYDSDYPTQIAHLSMLKGLVNAIIGGAIGFGLFLIIALLARGGMGFGDVKMAGMLGLATGYPLVLVAIQLAIVAGGLLAVILLVFKLKGRKEGIPFGPFLAVGTVVTLIYGREILHWYLNILL